MIAPKAQTLPKPVTTGTKSAAAKMAIAPETVPSQDRIRERAYELYEGRGREAGQDEQDWLRAEHEIQVEKR